MEIVSICCNQNVNSVNVECKQWLYRNGDQCVLNTGGWIKGLINSSTTPVSGTGGTANGSVSVNVSFNANNIGYACYGSAPALNGKDYEGRTYGRRAAISGNVNFGTVSALKTDISKYTKMHVTGTNGILAAFRTGSANNANTSISTATILGSGNANSMTLNFRSSHPYIVLGNTFSCGSENRWSDTGLNVSVGSYNFNAGGTITEIYLV